MILLEFASGAQGVIHASTVAGEETPFGQIHELDLHGDGGTLHARVDWDREQSIRGARQGEGAPQLLPIPEDDLARAPATTRCTTPTATSSARKRRMARQWVTAIAHGQPVRPDFADGAYIQRVMAAAQRSHAERRWIEVAGNTLHHGT